MNKYHVVINGSQQGPFSLEELREKNMTKTTLVWTEELDNWVEAANLEELQDLIKKMPPPIPLKPIEPLQVEAEISKKEESLISPKTEVLIAKETKSVFHQILYGFLIGIISFPVFYFGVYEVDKYDNVNLKITHYYHGISVEGIDTEDFPPFGEEVGEPFIKSMIERRRESLTEETFNSVLFTFLIATGILVAFRYIFIGANWVQETA